MERIFACAYGERRKNAKLWCGSVTSSVYWPAPVRKRMSSLRSMREPIGPVGLVAGRAAGLAAVVSVMAGSSSCHFRKAVFHGLHDVVVSGAAAEVAVERLADLGLGGLLGLAGEPDRGHHHARRAEAALQTVVLLERGLHGMELVAAREPFDGGDLGALRLDGEHVAALHRLAVDQHGAGAALRGV